MRWRARDLLVMALATAASAARGQTAHDAPPPQLAPRDSAHLLDRARAAQWHFEAYRRQELPHRLGDAHAPCTYSIGRLCYWADDPHERPVPEPRAITRARARLVRTLAGLAERSRTDGWIVGEEVRYLVQAGDDSAALEAARACRGTSWWCMALRGYVLHEGGDYLDAAAVFDSALAAMPADSACRWRDLSLLLEDDERDAYDRLPCAARRPLEQRYWALADPSYAVPGNERRTEHLARMVVAALSANAANPYGLRWGDDLRELLIRYGEPAWYTQPIAELLEQDRGVEGHDREPSYHFVPHLGPGDRVRWSLRDPRARERWAPPYVDSLVPLGAQFAMFRRGDSALVVVAYADPTAGDTAGAVLGVADAGAVRVATSGALRVRRTYAVGWHGIVAGVERLDAGRRIDARARVRLAPPPASPGAPSLSTVVLFAPDSAGVATLDDALPRALTTSVLPRDRRVGLYWEVYPPGDSAAGHAPGDSAGTGPDSVAAGGTLPRLPARDTLASRGDVTITVRRLESGALARLARVLHLAPRVRPVAIQWHDAPADAAVQPHTVVLDLARLPAGRYELAVSVGRDAVHRTTATRTITLP